MPAMCSHSLVEWLRWAPFSALHHQENCLVGLFRADLQSREGSRRERFPGLPFTWHGWLHHSSRRIAVGSSNLMKNFTQRGD
jgi:hypothetical protein